MEKAYIHVYETIKDRILTGAYVYNTKMPSKRETAKQFGVSLPTVVHALDMLEEEGYIRSEERSGYFVKYQKGEVFGYSGFREQFRNTLVNVDYSLPYSIFAKTAREVLSRYGDGLLGRSSGKGNLVLRNAIASYLARYRGMHVDAEHIVIGAGSEYLYSLVVSLLGRYRTYGIEDPSYGAIAKTYQSQDVVMDKLSLCENGILSSVLQQTKASVLHVTPYRSYPSNNSTTHEKREEYIEWVNKGDRWIVEDDYESEFTPAILFSETLYEMDSEHVIYMNTFSRTISPSIRISYMVLPDKLNELYDRTQSFRSCTVSLYMQMVVAELLNNGAFERHLNRIRQQKK